jgi:prepilin-type N-terminal cleavage/methylation domain-containing protein
MRIDGMKQTGDNTKSRGFTLMECMIALVLIVIAVCGVSSAVVAGNTETAAAVTMKRASELAWEMQERIAALPYDDKSGYSSYQESAGHLADVLGTLLPSDYQRFGRGVTVANETKTVAGLGSVAGLTVTVTVTDPKGTTMSITQFYPQAL